MHKHTHTTHSIVAILATYIRQLILDRLYLTAFRAVLTLNARSDPDLTNVHTSWYSNAFTLLKMKRLEEVRPHPQWYDIHVTLNRTGSSRISCR